MTAYDSPAVPSAAQPPTTGPAQRAAMMHFVAGALGVLSFIWGFLSWFTEGQGDRAFYFAGYAFSSAGAAPIGLSILAGAIAVAYTVDGKVTSFVPPAVAIAALLTVIGVAGGKGNVGPGDAQIGMGLGLILELVTCIVQAAVLLLAWLAANGRIGAPRPPAHPGYPITPPGYPTPGASYPGHGYADPAQAHAGYGPPSYVQPGYHPPAPPAPSAPSVPLVPPVPSSDQPGTPPGDQPTEHLRPPEGGYGEPRQ